ncbi:hypothetical protein AK830_g4784 [Neonectria ditissima]|uniref:Fibroin-3 n=1 Tax=Neonectria ditissima TaxID=78410 RepID=A0A0P7AV41_9HYPO|nr:hypothetical protein AK830_g4784 [Neonectria ditissima]
MPSIDVAMARSLRGSTWHILKEAVGRSIAAELVRRGVVDDTSDKASDVATTFSSWDNCMEEAYCKWPAIAVIAIVGLIVFSIVWCIIRCCCCGLSCCCGCCSRKAHKHLDDPYAPTTNHAYRSEPPMQPLGAQAPVPQASGTQFAPSTQHLRNEPPQYAEFETGNKRGDEDSLPEMPSWEGAGSKKIAMEEDVEMENLKNSPIPDQHNGIMNGAPSAMPQGRSPYGQQQDSHSGYLDHNAQAPEHYSPIDKGYGYNSSPSNGYGHDQSYAAGAMGVAPMGRNSPALNPHGYGQPPVDQGYDQSHNQYGNHDGYSNAAQGYGMRQSPGPRRTPAPQLDFDGYDQIASARSPVHQNAYGEYNQPARRTPAPQDSYNMPVRRTPAPQDEYNMPARRTPAPQDGYGQQNVFNSNQRTYSPAPEPHYGPRPVPQRHYPQQDPPQSPIINNSGFDFNSGNARPQQSPVQESYPGYKPYSPT